MTTTDITPAGEPTLTAVLWDMDGTLVDTEPLWGQATYALAREMGRELTPELREETVGGSTINTVRICAAHAGITLDAASTQSWIDWMSRTVSQLLAADLPWRPGVPELLADLSNAGIPQALVTNTARNLADVALRSIGSTHFRFTLCGDEVATGKPAPDIYLEAARRMDTPPENCLVFEDSTTGMRAAQAAGCTVVGVPTDAGTQIPAGVPTLHQLVGVEGPTDLGLWREHVARHTAHGDISPPLAVAHLRELWEKARLMRSGADAPSRLLHC